MAALVTFVVVIAIRNFALPAISAASSLGHALSHGWGLLVLGIVAFIAVRLISKKI